jgi:hypothetical protein
MLLTKMGDLNWAVPAYPASAANKYYITLMYYRICVSYLGYVA